MPRVVSEPIFLFKSVMYPPLVLNSEPFGSRWMASQYTGLKVEIQLLMIVSPPTLVMVFFNLMLK